jgi:uncharacterized membrane protein YjjP (DUF1212 family)
MEKLPDLWFLFYLAMFGFACSALITLIGGGWLAYHLYMALALYFGA